MAKAKTPSSSSRPPKMRPALMPESRENQMISLAESLAEQQLLEGTASSQIIVHYLKLGTANARLEREKLAHETELLKAKTESLQSQKRMEEMYSAAIAAMRNYNGQGDPDEY